MTALNSHPTRDLELAGRELPSADSARQAHGMLVLGVVAISMLLTTPAASRSDVRRVSYGGFGTAGLTYHDQDGLEYRRSTNQPRGATGGEVDLETDSLIGIQINAIWNPTIDAVVQGVSHLTVDGDWQPELTRAALHFDTGINLHLRAGRIGWEIFPRADSRRVGYSQISIRPPLESFSYIPSEHFDGIKLDWIRPAGPGLMRLDLYVGEFDAKVASRDGSVNDLDGSTVWGGHIEYTLDAWVLRAGAGVFLLDELPDYGSLIPGLREAGTPEALALANTLSNGDRGVDFIALGASYDRGPLQARLFLGQTDIDNFAGPDIYTGSLIGGLRIGTLTPYALASFIQNQNGVRPTGLPDDAEHAALNAGARAAQAPTRYNQHTLAVGIRHDVASGLAIKAQIDRVRLRDTALVFNRNTPPGKAVDMTVFGLALDFVW